MNFSYLRIPDQYTDVSICWRIAYWLLNIHTNEKLKKINPFLVSIEYIICFNFGRVSYIMNGVILLSNSFSAWIIVDKKLYQNEIRGVYMTFFFLTRQQKTSCAEEGHALNFHLLKLSWSNFITLIRTVKCTWVKIWYI